MPGIGANISLGAGSRGWLPERDAPGIYGYWSANAPGTNWQDSVGGTAADAAGEVIAAVTSLTNPALRGVQGSAALQPVLQAFNGTHLGWYFDPTNDRLEFEATCRDVLNDAPGLSLYVSLKPTRLTTGFKRLVYISNDSGLTKAILNQTYNAANDIPNMPIRRVDGASSITTSFPNWTLYEEMIVSIVYDANTGVIRYSLNGTQEGSTADISGTVGDGNFSALGSDFFYCGEAMNGLISTLAVARLPHDVGTERALVDAIARRDGY